MWGVQVSWLGLRGGPGVRAEAEEEEGARAGAGAGRVRRRGRRKQRSMTASWEVAMLLDRGLWVRGEPRQQAPGGAVGWAGEGVMTQVWSGLMEPLEYDRHHM